MPKKPRKPRKSKADMPPTSFPPTLPPTGDEKEERQEYYAEQVTIMDCGPAHFDHTEGEPATGITIARKTDIEQLVITQKDARLLVARLLVSLATYEDKFAQKLLDENFPADDDGNFVWPHPDD